VDTGDTGDTGDIGDNSKCAAASSKCAAANSRLVVPVGCLTSVSRLDSKRLSLLLILDVEA